MLLLGHRGTRCSRSIPENTFAAFDLAIQQGCHGFEFDVRLTADGVPVVCHDARFGRLPISRATAFGLQDLPSLEAVLDRYSTGAFLDIELKVHGIEASTVELLSGKPPSKGFVVSSFLPRVLLELRRLDATVPLGLICETRPQLRRGQELPIQTVIAHYSLATRKLLNEVHASGKSLYVWTVNGYSTMVRLAEWGVDGIISDRTDVLGQLAAGFSYSPFTPR